MDRNHLLLLPPYLDEWVPKDHPARVVDMFVEDLDTKGMGFKEENEEMGRPSYNPKVMLKIIIALGSGHQGS